MSQRHLSLIDTLLHENVLKHKNLGNIGLLLSPSKSSEYLITKLYLHNQTSNNPNTCSLIPLDLQTKKILLFLNIPYLTVSNIENSDVRLELLIHQINHPLQCLDIQNDQNFLHLKLMYSISNKIITFSENSTSTSQLVPNYDSFLSTIPLEIIPLAYRKIQRELHSLQISSKLRMNLNNSLASSSPVKTLNGNYILDINLSNFPLHDFNNGDNDASNKSKANTLKDLNNYLIQLIGVVEVGILDYMITKSYYLNDSISDYKSNQSPLESRVWRL